MIVLCMGFIRLHLLEQLLHLCKDIWSLFVWWSHFGQVFVGKQQM